MTGLYERDLAVTADGQEIYWTVVLGTFDSAAIVQVLRGVDGTWGELEVAPFSGRYRNLEPTIAPDGQRLYFVSNRPLAGDGDPIDYSDIWYVERAGDDWGEPINVGAPVNSASPEFFPSLTNGGTMYLTRDEPDGTSRIYRAARDGNNWSPPVALGEAINSARSQFNALVAPDESYLIFSALGRDDSLGSIDYYVSFAGDAAGTDWSAPVNLGPRVNSASPDEYSASISPGGEYLFFMSSRSRYRDLADQPRSYAGLRGGHGEPGNGLSGIYWIHAAFLRDLKSKGVAR